MPRERPAKPASLQELICAYWGSSSPGAIMRMEIHPSGNDVKIIPEARCGRTPGVLVVIYLIILTWAVLAWV